ncbi:MAG: S41 family peptidase [Clostridia bacterium]|nr:S41 family peptidase [Clostridia bacterium]
MEGKNKNSFYKSFILVVVTALITCVLTTGIIYNCFLLKRLGVNKENGGIGKTVDGIVSSISGNSNNISVDDKISAIKKKLDEVYIGDVNEEKMVEGALKGYVSALGDEYTEYLTEKEVESLMEDINGSYVGVGTYISYNTKTNEIVVIGVIEDAPANKAGILVGDIIKKIDGVEYKGEQLTEASNKMKGEEGTNVKLAILRDEKELEFEIKREKIKFKCVKSEKLENDIGYIKISSFDGGCAEDFKNEYNSLKEKGIKSLIIDLRNNGGGLVDQSLDIAEMIVPKGSTMLITRDKNGKEELSKSEKDPIINIPIVVLVNDYTASASEILTAALKENTNAKVVGIKTYGKGVIQGVFLLENQKTGMKVTIQEYYTPKHNKLHKIGITPDEIVELPEELKGQVNIEKQKDTQLNKAIELLK